ncbi:hypothetical protein [Dyadobacter sp.]|uniref:hypothetical protein n=1 Tax=Dyadobacter sp. TaxID=1914288 RepID=UPI003F72BD1B
MGSIVSKIADEIKLHGSLEAYFLFMEGQRESDTVPSEAAIYKSYYVTPLYAGENVINKAGQPCRVTEELFWILVATQLKEISKGTARDQVIREAMSKVGKYIETAKTPFTIWKLSFQIIPGDFR